VNKKDLRSAYLQKRRDLLPDEINELSQAIVDRFTELSLSEIKNVHIFYPIPGKHEFNSLLLKEFLKQNYPEIKFILPKSNTTDFTLHNILWEEDTPLAMNQWGITEPEEGVEVPAREIDAVIIPLLAFDEKGNRLGYGKGFYDRFLISCRPDALKIGVSYFSPEQQFEELDAYDVPIDVCVTPNKIWYFNQP
jgi:5-formyltetrahydrofolate cyclo-ligase